MTIFKAYDIRGIYEKDLTEKDAYMIGFYLAKQLNISDIKVAHDLRLSHENLTKFLIQGLLDADVDVVYCGKSSTPNFYFSLFGDINSGIMVTASHNPKEYNGFKIMYEGISFDSRNGLYELEKLVQNDEFAKALDYNMIEDSLSNIPLHDFLEEREVTIFSYNKQYSMFLMDFYDILLEEKEKEAIQNLNFALDFSSGVSSISVIPMIEHTKLKCKYFNEKPNGNFPVHSPDPVLAQDFMKSQFSQEKLFFGAAFDGDGDRLVFFDGDGEIIFQDYVIAKFIDFFSEKNRNFVCDLRVSRVISDLAKEKNLDVGLIRVGRAFYQDYMVKNQCVFGAELSGHMFFRDFHSFDNPDIALIYMLKIIATHLLKNKEISFKELFEKYKKYTKVSEKSMKVKDADKVLNSLKLKFKDSIVSEIDGLSFDFGDYWFNIRKSNTEPVIKINFEARNQNVAKIELEKLINFIEKL